MILNYLNLTIRLLVRNPFFTTINFTCLSVGFAMFVMLWQHSQTELHSDQYHPEADRIYRAGINWNWSDNGTTWQAAKYGGLGAQGALEMMTTFGDFDEAVGVYPQGIFSCPNFGHGNDVFLTTIDDLEQKRSFRERNIAYADSNLFHFFNIPIIKGNGYDVLRDFRTTLLSESMAKKYFGDADPVGEILYLNDSIPLTITGIFKDLPTNTHLNFNLVISTTGLKLEEYQGYQLSHAYFKLKPGRIPGDLNSKFEQMVNRVFAQMPDFKKGLLKIDIFLQPLSEVPFTTLTTDTFVAKSKPFLIIIGILSFVVLTMAWVNYINLARANNQQRLRELAARKSVGATTSDFVKQFLLEAAVINILSFIAALTFIQLVHTPAEVLFQFHISNWSEIDLSSWMIVTAVGVSGILITGLYPAWVTIRSTPKVLFGTSKRTNSRNIFTNILTTFQYAAAIVLIAWAIAINFQLDFIFNKDIGMTRDNVLIIDLPIRRDGNFESSLNYFMKQAQLLPTVSGATVSTSISGDTDIYGVGLKRRNGVTNPAIDTNGGVDENFIPFYNIKLIAGRNFSSANAADENAIILSRLATSRMGYSKPEDALGTQLEAPNAHVIGIMEDYAVKPLLTEFNTNVHGSRGLFLTYGSKVAGGSKNKISLKIKDARMGEAIDALQAIYKVAFPSSPFETYFLDSHINQYYMGERIFSQQITLFTAIAIFIACLGLLGMMRIRVLQYAKELAIRKVLGARLDQLGRLLLTSSFGQVAIATALGLPVAYYLNIEYLQKFSERVVLGWWQYLTPVAIFIMLLFISIVPLIIKASRANPVDALHHE